MEPEHATRPTSGTQTAPSDVAGGRTRPGVVALAALIGTTIEWYDFYIYGTATALVIAPQFFPNVSPLAGTLASLSTFGVGFVARPIGGAIMGHVGDRVGRKSMLIASLLLMGVATALIGVLPNYAAIGAAAPVLLVVLRFAQGLGVGGEWGGAVLMSVEHAPPGRRAFYGSLPQMGVPLGVLLSSLAFLALQAVMTPEEFSSWGWRLPFLSSALLIVLGIVLRLRLTESPVFEALRADRRRSRLPVAEVLRTRPLNLLAAIAISVAPSGLGNLLLVWTITYTTRTLQVPSSTLLWISVAMTAVYAAVIPLASRLADRFSRQRVFLVAAGACVLWAFPYFWLINTRSVGAILLAMSVAAAVVGSLSSIHSGLVAYAFPARVRYSGASIAYGLGGVAGGAIAPIIATALFAAFVSTTPVSLYIVAAGVVSGIAAAGVVSDINADHRPE